MIDFETPKLSDEYYPDESEVVLLEHESGEPPEPVPESRTEDSAVREPEKSDILLQLGFPPEQIVFVGPEVDEVAQRMLEVLNLASYSALTFEALSKLADQSRFDINVSEVPEKREDAPSLPEIERQPNPPWFQITLNELLGTSLTGYTFRFRESSPGLFEIVTIPDRDARPGSAGVWAIDSEGFQERRRNLTHT